MVAAKKLTILALVLAVVAVPFVFRERDGGVIPVDGLETLTIITAHNESLRREYAIGFKKWYRAKTGRDVNVDWRYPGGGRDTARYVESTYANNFRIHWTEKLHRQWSLAVATAFAHRSERALDSPDALEAEVVGEFFASNVGCGIDLQFGGGVFEAELQADRGNFVPCGLLEEHPELFSEDTIPECFAGSRLWDRRGRWFGGSLSTFGIIYNRDAILEEGIGFFPETWMDLGREEFFKRLAIVDPTKSSSVQKAFELLIQQRMQVCYESRRAIRGGDKLGAEEERTAVAEGWENGLRLIQKIVANGQYFTESTTRPMVDVSLGNCLAGIAVDFYGFAEAKHLEERSGSKRFRFIMPRNGGAPSPDPIGMFRGAPNPTLAREFIEFVVSLDGQKILDFNLNTPGGPEKTTMRRVPILRTIYDHRYDKYRCDPSINPYEASASFVFHEDWTRPVYDVIGPLIKLAFIELHRELSAAMGAIIAARREGRLADAERAYALLSSMDSLAYAPTISEIRPILRSRDVLAVAKLRHAIGEGFRARYLEAERIANGNSPLECGPGAPSSETDSNPAR
jgi:ABC-type Fe3+ transport system substrate-binding protein